MRRFALAPLLFVLALTPCAHAWTDARPSGLVTELAIDRDGGARVTLRVRCRVLAGRFRAFDIAELPADVALLEATGSDATGNDVSVANSIPGAGRLQDTFDEEDGLRLGSIDAVNYSSSLPPSQ